MDTRDVIPQSLTSGRWPALLLAATLLGCGAGGTVSPPPPTPPSQLALDYTNAAVDLMQHNSINRYRIDWVALRATAIKRIGPALSSRDTYEAIREAIVALGDNHSFFVEPPSPVPASLDHASVDASRSVGTASMPAAQLLTGHIGYLWVPDISGLATLAEAQVYADELHKQITLIDSVVTCGWVVDLRGNLGGNMWPMIAGLGPVLGEGTLGAFVDPDSNRTTWFYRDGGAGVRTPSYELVQARVSGPAYRLVRPDPPVAVLYGPTTRSSGEAVAIAFRGRPQARSFGLPTYGLSTANAGFALRDGALLVLTVAADVDRSGIIYGGVVAPDVVVTRQTINPNVPQDEVNAAATAWLKSLAVCKP